MRLFRAGKQKGAIGGSTAVEFALLAVPFITMLVGIVEVALFFGCAVVLEGAASDASRMIRTGQVQTSGDPVGTFTTQLCDRVSLLIDCAQIQYEVMPVPEDNFLNVAAMGPVFDGDGNLVSSGFDPGQSEDVVLVRIAYRYEFLVPMLGAMMEATESTNDSLLVSTIVIRNEPYAFGS